MEYFTAIIQTCTLKCCIMIAKYASEINVVSMLKDEFYLLSFSPFSWQVLAGH